jgi:hypothetical protein
MLIDKAVAPWLLAGILVCGCGGPIEAEDAMYPAGSESTALESDPSVDPACHFERGVTTCVITSVAAGISSHQEFSGCSVFTGTVIAPGSRVRTFDDTYEVTTTTIRLSHGRNGKVFSEDTKVDSTLMSSTLSSDVCTPLRSSPAVRPDIPAPLNLS